MSNARRLVPSRAMAVALLALFLNLAGVAWAANGGSFLLGKSNSATATTKLTASPATNVPALAVVNNHSGSPAGAFSVSGSAAPFTVNSTTTVAKLDADLLDGLDSTALATTARLASGVYAPGASIQPVTLGHLSLTFSCFTNAQQQVELDVRAIDDGPVRGTLDDQQLFSDGVGGQVATPYIASVPIAVGGSDVATSVESSPQGAQGSAAMATLVWDDGTETVVATYSARATSFDCRLRGALYRVA